tara:strand:+ start:2057 stop:2359 length:303 start_codon:yes stop_codon:yes gene_type:complete
MIKNLKKNYFLIISTFLVLYFFFNLMSGERGLVSYLEKKDILMDLKIKESNLLGEIENLDFKNSLLSDNLDLDYVEILIRERFIFGKKNENIYIIKNNEN